MVVEVVVERAHKNMERMEAVDLDTKLAAALLMDFEF